jgi:hypothetical protein
LLELTWRISFVSPCFMEVLYDKNKPLYMFRDVVASERQNLFIKKLQLCSYTWDFTDATAHVREKEIKRQTLLVGPGGGRYCSPRHPTHNGPSSLEFNGTL